MNRFEDFSERKDHRLYELLQRAKSYCDSVPFFFSGVGFQATFFLELMVFGKAINENRLSGSTCSMLKYRFKPCKSRFFCSIA